MPALCQSQAEVQTAAPYLRSAKNRCGTQLETDLSPRSLECDLGAENWLDINVGEDTMLADEADWPALVPGRRSK